MMLNRVTLACALLASSVVGHAAPQLTQAIPIPGATRWDYVTADTRAHRVYVAHMDRVEVIDARTHQLVLQLSPTSGVHGAAPAPGLNRVFTSNGSSDSMGVFDMTTGQLLATVKVGKKPDAIIYDSLTQRVFTFNGKSNDVTAVDAVTLKVLAASIPAGGVPEFAVANGKGLVYFNIEDAGQVAVLDTRSMRITSHYSLAPCNEPSGIAMDPQERLYSACRNAIMVIGDPSRGVVIGQVPTGRGADGAAWMDGFAYSPNGLDGTLTVVKEGPTGQFSGVTTPSAQGARTIVADPELHELYSPTADFKEPGDKDQSKRPAAVPDTFKLVVITNPR